MAYFYRVYIYYELYWVSVMISQKLSPPEKDNCIGGKIIVLITKPTWTENKFYLWPNNQALYDAIIGTKVTLFE